MFPELRMEEGAEGREGGRGEKERGEMMFNVAGEKVAVRSMSKRGLLHCGHNTTVEDIV